MARPTSVSIPTAIADEIAIAAAGAERSVAFLALGALKAAGPLSGAVESSPARELILSTDEDDPRDLATRLKKLVAEKAPGRSLDEAVALAWQQRRGQILAFIARIAAVNEGERADDLDEGLRAAADPSTAPARLIALAKSAYPRVRALVASHPSAPEEAVRLLGDDRERIVREALLARA